MPVSAEVKKERNLISNLAIFTRHERTNFRHSMPDSLQSMVNYLGLSNLNELFLCQICYDYVPVSKSYALVVCGHIFCQACLKSFWNLKLKKDKSCNAAISVDDIQALVSQRVWQKYTTFKFNKDHELARQCPYCDHSQVCAGSENPECICEACNREFCFLHNNAHQDETCAAYERSMIAIEKLNNSLISKISRRCPGCQNYVEKIGGCNQMKCVVCSTSFCWICLKIIDDSVFPEHFQWWNIRGCAGNQMLDNEGQSATQKEL
ncbi:putative Zinc finger, RING-type, IBR domain, Zinc finger, RING/FYVE/PHD-type [Plasmopara halstedii]